MLNAAALLRPQSIGVSTDAKPLAQGQLQTDCIASSLSGGSVSRHT